VGVDLFFVLSGFLVGGLLMKEYKRTQALEVSRFIFRRGMKIWPAYYFFLILIVVTHAHPLGTFLWQNLLHIQNYAGTSIAHTWSLAVEEHFYLVLALAMGWMVRRHYAPQRILKLLLTVMVMVLVCRTICYFAFGAGVSFMQTQNRLDSLTCGVSLALLFHFFPKQFQALSRRKRILAPVAALVVLFLCTVRNEMIMHTIGYTITYIGAAAFLLLVYSHSERIRNWIPYRIVAVIGVYSYGIYLYHNAVRNPALTLAKHAPPALQWPVLMLLQYSAAIVAGAALTRIVEWPFLRYRDRILPQRVGDIGSPDSAETDIRIAPAETS
jgi:peptidoglycan/LPS O-acetylase OafA/YrhL